MSNNKQLVWAAGVLENRGHLGVQRQRVSGRERGYFKLRLSSSDQEFLTRFRSVVGEGRIDGPYTYTSTTTYWTWVCVGRPAWEVVKRLRPYLSAQRTAEVELVANACSPHPAKTRTYRRATRA